MLYFKQQSNTEWSVCSVYAALIQYMVTTVYADDKLMEQCVISENSLSSLSLFSNTSDHFYEEIAEEKWNIEINNRS